MKQASLARRYARAIVATVADEAGFRSLQAELARFAALLEGDDTVRSGLSTFLVPRAVRRELVATVAARLGLQPVSRQALDLLVEENRLPVLPGILEQMDRVWDERNLCERVVVRSAVALNEGQLRRLEQNLGRSFGTTVVVENQLDPELMGGLAVVRGSTTYDFSLSGNLKKLRQALISER
jgi:F-type H+-transporting ATPase subunit delta